LGGDLLQTGEHPDYHRQINARFHKFSIFVTAGFITPLHKHDKHKYTSQCNPMAAEGDVADGRVSLSPILRVTRLV
jgi:hypothetical protein